MAMSGAGRVVMLGLVMVLPWNGLLRPAGGDWLSLSGAAMAGDDDDDDREDREDREDRDDRSDDREDREDDAEDEEEDRRDDEEDAAEDRRDEAEDAAEDRRDEAEDRRDEAEDAAEDRRDDAEDAAEDRREADADRREERRREDRGRDDRGRGQDGGAARGGADPDRPGPGGAPEGAREVVGEIVALDLSEADLAALVAQGYVVIGETAIPELGTQTRRLKPPAGVSEEAARAAVRALPSGADADFNHFYRAEEGLVPASAPAPAPGPAPEGALTCEGMYCAAFEQIAWPVAPSREVACGTPVTIGLIDTGLNAEHATFAGARIEVTRLSDATLDPSRAVHGTATAAILVGAPDSRSPGLVPWARLVAVDAFHRVGQDERADVVALIEGLGYLAEQGVGVINLSLAGPPNTVLEEAIARLVNEQGIVIVAAAGNGGPRAEPAYPAAYDGVIAVTAIDGGDGVYRRAQQGDYVDLAAPGVEVWTAASVSGARSKTGTSFAVPFVTAAAVLVRQGNPALSPAEVEARLEAAARDLGDPGRDPVFGAGALMAAGLCAQAAPVVADTPAVVAAGGVQAGPPEPGAAEPAGQGAMAPAGAETGAETGAESGADAGAETAADAGANGGPADADPLSAEPASD